MNREIRFTIYEKPMILRRHRTAKSGATFDSQKKDKLYLGILIKRAIEQHCSLKEHMLQPPIALDVKFYFGLPKSKSARKHKGLYHCDHKGDLDNMVKAIADVMEGLLYTNDCHLFKINSQKLYTNTKPRTEVIIKEVMQEEIIEENHGKDTSVKGSESTHMSSQIWGVSSQQVKTGKNIIPAILPNKI